MKTLRKLLKLGIPGFIMHWWLRHRYGMKPAPVSPSVFVRLSAEVLPYCFAVILRQRVESDRRVGKYFLPYVIMRKRMMHVYGVDVTCVRNVGRLAESVQSILPYGLVLWWNSPDAQGDSQKRRAAAAARRPGGCRGDVLEFAAIFEVYRLTAPGKPLVSFVVPVYNAEGTLARCLESIRSVPVSDIEIICIDDGSTDGSLKRLEEYAAADQRITVRSQPNSGQGAARNLGIDLASGSFIQFVDSDDYIEPSMYPRVLRPFVDSPDIDYVQFSATCRFDFKPSEKQKRWGANLFVRKLDAGEHEMDREAYISTIVVDKVFRSSFLRGNRIRFPAGVKQEDEAFSFFVFSKASKFHYIPERWYNYVRTATGTMSSQEARALDSRMPDAYSVFLFVFEYIRRNGDLLLLGYFYKRVVGATSRFFGTPVEEQCRDCAAWLLKQGGFGVFREMMSYVDDSPWLKNLAFDLFTRDVSRSPQIPALDAEYPVPLVPVPQSPSPRLCYLVFMDQAAAFAPLGIQSIVGQRERDVEVVCVAPHPSPQTLSVVKRFLEIDGRVKFVDLGGIEAEDRKSQIRAGLGATVADYVVLHDAKDLLPSNHAGECLRATATRPDVVVVPVAPCGNAASAPWRGHGVNSNCYRRDFLSKALESSPSWNYSADPMLVHLLLSAGSVSVADGTSCRVRKVSPGEVAPMDAFARAERSKACVQDLADVIRRIQLQDSSGRSYAPLLAYAMESMRSIERAVPGMTPDASRPIPELYATELRGIEAARKEVGQDMYIIVSFLRDPYAECIDSWLLFEYLRGRGVPAKYVTPSYSRFYKKVVRHSVWACDVLPIADDSLRSCEMFEAMLPHLYRVKAVVCEDGYLPDGMAAYFRDLDRLLFVYMGHGMVYLWLNELMASRRALFNAVNTSGLPEAKRFERYYAARGEKMPFKMLEGGLPRYDLLDTVEPRTRNRRLVLVSLSWRNDLNTQEKLRRSLFFRKLSALLADGVWRRLKDRNVDVVVSAHHAIRRTLGSERCFGRNVKLIDPMEVSRYIREADCLVTDLSSIAFDFVYQGKPVVFWIPDADDYTLSYISRTKIEDAKARAGEISVLAHTIAEVSDNLLSFADADFRINDSCAGDHSGLFYARGMARERIFGSMESAWRDMYGGGVAS